MSVAEAQQKIDSEEFIEWLVWDKERERKPDMGPDEIYRQMESMRQWQQQSGTSRRSSL